MANATITTRLTLMPIRRAAGRSSATACIERPRRVRVTNTVRSASSTVPMRKLATFSLGTSSGPREMAPDSSSGAGNEIWTGLPANRLASSAEFWRIWPTANEDSSSATSGPPRSGR